MGKIIIGGFIVGGILFLAGEYPHVAVSITAIAIVAIFKIGDWFNN